MCCVKDNIYLVGGQGDRVIEYNISMNTWRVLPSLQQERSRDASVCSLNNKIFVLGGDGYNNTICEMLDLSDDF